ncbi:DUF2630 family protein [Arthrobacter sp. zg-Y820]|uniref:DUF2630 family protein n=1 Tax=unclassified Arthrobacter TaxID=235627 RepID=UPI001E4573FA|nr:MULTISPECIES: DUF2630 family protein [unclassified Arthrobacter]MCC9197408.1 DUF2630 family protein [Arthrobacter sp. zg-Y820]MDK1280274.1 DUF2630 family protein [Arthrobacter sp. zg.Y820]MDK1360589.1 DUF2630 family protein [Arthrobacter sp. zg-Y1219]WIB09561.1 DUF2630 family protein [Arthrobacter sp. zg-Y820]
MDATEIQHRISELVEQEQSLRDSSAAEHPEDRMEQLRRIEEQLDQCWDLLRQRRARLHAGEDPDDAAVRPASEVEGYKQ